MTTLGKRLAAARQIRGMSQADLAAAIDMSRQMIGLFETDNAAPTDEQKIKLESFLRLRLDDPRLVSLLSENQLPQVA